MARQVNRLNARSIASLGDGRHADGNGLYLSVGNGGRSWTFLYRFNGRRVELGLGPASTVSLARARDLARHCRNMLAEGIDPKVARRPTQGRSFADCAARYVEAHESEWTNAKHAREWREGFQRLAPSLLALDVAAIDTEAVLGVLKPLWAKKRETASRLRGRIELVLSAAKAEGLRTGENPAMWRGHLDHLLSKAPKQSLKKHLPALPYQELPALMARLRERTSVAARALEFAILTAARADEVVSAKWSEFSFDAELWTVPASSMKGRREHRVPLVGRALAIVHEMAKLRSSDFVFPGRFRGSPFGHNALNECLQGRMGVKDATQHGMRSTFRDWCGDCTSFPREIAEAALAHKIGGDVERAYRRGDALDKRRELMRAWDAFCATGDASKVVALAGRRAARSGGRVTAIGTAAVRTVATNLRAIRT
jgi:integrase